MISSTLAKQTNVKSDFGVGLRVKELLHQALIFSGKFKGLYYGA